MQNLAENIWIFDGEAVPFYTMPYTTRMTVVRLASGELWVHSPIRLTPALHNDIQSLGEVKYLIAPNHLHHLFLADWQAAFPNAASYGTPEVIKKCDDLRFEGSLGEAQLWPWADEIETEMFTGSPFMEECIFFYKSTRVLIVTDLIENFPPQHFNFWQRAIAKVVGVLSPNGKMPLDWRLSFYRRKKEAREHMKTIMGWQPDTVVMAHGEVVAQDAQGFLNRSFSWLM